METIDMSKGENPNTPLLKNALTYSFILSGVGIAFMIIGHTTGWQMESMSYKLVNWALSIGGIFVIVKHFRDQRNGGFLRIGQGVGLCTLTGLFVGIIFACFFYFFVTQMAPEFVTNIQDQAIENMTEQGLNDEQIAQSMEVARMFMGAGFMSAMALVGSVVSYALLGLIASAILKRD